MAKETKVVKVSADTLKGWINRSVFTPSMQKVVQDWEKKGYQLHSTVPVNNWLGKTTHYLLNFEKEK